MLNVDETTNSIITCFLHCTDHFGVNGLSETATICTVLNLEMYFCLNTAIRTTAESPQDHEVV